MKKSICIVTWFIFACGPTDSVRFDAPQPPGVEPLNKFSDRIQGDYVDFCDQNILLTIEKGLIRRTGVFTFACRRSEVEPDSSANVNILNDKELTEYLNKQGGVARIVNDSVFFSEIWKDTLFKISTEHVLKKFRSNYYLNFKLEPNYWLVKKVSLLKDTLYIGEITPGDTLLRFDFVSKETDLEKNDTGKTEIQLSDYIFKPNRKEFKELLKSEVFSITEKYVKVKRQ
jgi:hypothetical protein